MIFKCELKEMVSQAAITIRVKVAVQELPSVFEKGYKELFEYMDEMKVSPDGSPFAIYYNMDMQNLDVEYGFPLMKGLPDRGELKASETVSGKAASCIHKGPYKDLGLSYDKLLKWMEENGYKAKGVACEIYLNDPESTPSEELRTEIYLLIEDDE